MKYSDSTIERINSTANLFDVISEFVTLHKQVGSYYGKCPMCNKEGKGKGLILTPAKSIYKCFSCDFSGNNPVQYLMKAENKTYPQALEYLIEKFHILVDDAEPAKKLNPQKKAKPTSQKVKSFRDTQLQQSGITDADQKALVYVDEDTQSLVDVYESGTRDQYGQIVHGDDMIIWYYDLDGKPVMFQKPKSTKLEHLFRVRWQNPALHCDKNGTPMKYTSPAGSGSHIYIPEPVRKAYQAKQYQKRLFIQEGEKKTDKANKHGLFSVGIMGIHNIASKGHLPYEFQMLIKTLQIQEIIFVLDSDWDHISENIKPGAFADNRPRTFFRAVVNFRDYFKTFTNIGIYLETYFGYVLPTEKNDKGIDDLLVNTLKGRENELLTDVNEALNDKNGEGKYLKFHKISTLPETKLQELWCLDNAERFAEKHKEKLLNIPEFRINFLKWRFSPDGKLELAQPLMPDEQYWEKDEWVDKTGRERCTYQFNYNRAYNFLRNRGYGRINMIDGTFKFAQQESRIVRLVDSYQIKDFVTTLTKEIAPEDILNMIYRGGKMYFGPDSLSNIDFMYPEFEKPRRDAQNIYFKDKYWEITAGAITEKNLSDLEYYVWNDKLNAFDARLIPNKLMDITQITDSFIESLPQQKRENFAQYKNQFLIDVTAQGNNCHFLRFLWNTGEFYWEKLQFDSRRNIVSDSRSDAEKMETNLHMVSKMSALGYLMHRYRNKSEVKAIIGMDGKLSEVGSSNGRTGKSILGFALGYMIPVTYIPGKSRNLTEDRFIFEEVNEKTCIIFIDDVRAKIDFEFFFPFLGGRATIEKKAIGKCTLPDDQTPKLYITTNHSIEGEGSSHRDRKFEIAFSDYYNDKHKPINDFGIQFFEEWDADQWNLFYNFMAQCLQVYLKYGLVNQPVDRVEKRRLRQQIGEEFFTWADEYYSVEKEGSANANIGVPIARKQLFDAFLDANQAHKKYYTPNIFKKKFKWWCEFWELQFNPHRFDKFNNPGADDKSNGVEYFTVGIIETDF